MAPSPFLEAIKRSIPDRSQIFDYATDSFLIIMDLPGTKVKRADDDDKKSTKTEAPSKPHYNTTPIPYKPGSVKPTDFSKGILVIFCLLGAGLALLAWWFFAKRGGFVWREGDWDDYCSTVMRKKDANGNTIASGSTRAQTVTTDITYQDGETCYDEEARTEKSRPDSEHGEGRKKKGLGAFKKLKPKWGRRKTGMSEATERTSYEYDPDLESYADEEPARMASYNPHPVDAPSIADGSEMSERNVHDDGRGAYRPDRHPSRYAYAYTASETSGVRSNADRSDRSQPLGPRRPTQKGSGGTTKSKRTDSRAQRNTYQERDLSTIDDEGESRLSFEAEDDAAFSVSAPSTKLTGGRNNTKAYPYPVTEKHKQYPSQRQSNVKQRVTSHGTYQSTGDTSGEECDSDCSCCTTESESETEETGSSALGDMGTKVYSHPLGLGITGSNGKLMKPSDALVINKNRGGTPVRSYRKDSRGSLSSDDSEGEGSVVESSISAPSSRRAPVSGRR